MNFFQKLKKQFSLLPMEYHGGHPELSVRLKLGAERVDRSIVFHAGVKPVLTIDLNQISSVSLDPKSKKIKVEIKYNSMDLTLIFSGSAGLKTENLYPQFMRLLA